jgi:hypothetical protein
MLKVSLQASRHIISKRTSRAYCSRRAGSSESLLSSPPLFPHPQVTYDAPSLIYSQQHGSRVRQKPPTPINAEDIQEIAGVVPDAVIRKFAQTLGVDVSLTEVETTTSKWLMLHLRLQQRLPSAVLTSSERRLGRLFEKVIPHHRY